MSFSKLGLTPALCSPLARLGYQQPTPIQSRAIPLALEGADLLATIGFLGPAIEIQSQLAEL